MRKYVLPAAAILGIGIATAGCSSWAATHSHNVPIQHYVNHSNKIIDTPYNYNNVVLVCNQGDGVYVNRGEYGSVYVVREDPACRGKA